MNSDSDLQQVDSLSPTALPLARSWKEREQNRVGIEAVLRREATVAEFVRSRFEDSRTAPVAPPAGLRQRLRRVLRNLLRKCKPSRLAPQHALQRTVWPEWLTDGLADDVEQRFTITYYYPWGCFHPVRSGAAAVASRHLDYFRERGHRVRMLVRATPNQDRSAFERYYDWVDDLAIVDAGKYPEVQRCFDTWNFGSYLAAHAKLAERPEVRKWLSRPTDIAFVNYVFATPLLDALPASAYRVLETYDIMSHQFLEHRGSTNEIEESLSCEFDLYRLYDSVLMINAEEDQVARARCVAPLTYMPPAVDVTPVGSEKSGNEPYDLLFVGSDHPPNVEGVTWFYNHVYRPFLKAQGLRWAICGSVCRQLAFKDAGVDRLGSVADLGELYVRSKVVVVPLFRGSGISIKTLEAMGRGKPVITTPCGRRGLPSSADEALITSPFDVEPKAVADTIRRFCSSEALRKDYGRRAALFISEHFSSRSYTGRMDRIFQRVAGGTQASDAHLQQRNQTEGTLTELEAA